jgi:hypothetical protein
VALLRAGGPPPAGAGGGQHQHQQDSARGPQSNDPWFRFFFGDRGDLQQQQTGLGSGVIVSPEGYLLTNNHVVEGADAIEVVLPDGASTTAKVIGTDPESDLAVLKITLDKLPAITLGNVRRAAGGRPGAGHRQPVQRRPDGDQRASSARWGATSWASTPSRTSSRPTPPSTPATRAARWSTSTAT